jgi:hypothetical protein
MTSFALVVAQTVRSKLMPNREQENLIPALNWRDVLEDMKDAKEVPGVLKELLNHVRVVAKSVEERELTRGLKASGRCSLCLAAIWLFYDAAANRNGIRLILKSASDCMCGHKREDRHLHYISAT